MALTNDQMKAGRFLNLAKGRKLFARMNQAWNNGGFVRIGTAARYTDYKPKHREMVRLDSAGAIWVQHGKNWLCAPIGGCSFQFSA